MDFSTDMFVIACDLFFLDLLGVFQLLNWYDITFVSDLLFREH